MDISEATATAEEARTIHRIVREHLERAKSAGRFPVQLQGTFEVSFGEDWLGYPMASIWLHLTGEGHHRPGGMALLTEFLSSLREELNRAGLRHWPYVDIRPGT